MMELPSFVEEPRGLHTRGGELITIFGRYFGTDEVTITIGGQPCWRDAERTIQSLSPISCTGTGCLRREQSVQCYTPEGDGPSESNLVTVQKGSQRSCTVESTNGLCEPLYIGYKPPRILTASSNMFLTTGGQMNIEAP